MPRGLNVLRTIRLREKSSAWSRARAEVGPDRVNARVREASPRERQSAGLLWYKSTFDWRAPTDKYEANVPDAPTLAESRTASGCVAYGDLFQLRARRSGRLMDDTGIAPLFRSGRAQRASWPSR